METVTPDRLLSSGSTLLNLETSGHPAGAYLKGKYHHLVGDSSSGKSVYAFTALAEAAVSRHFRDYRLIVDNPEGGMMMDLEKYFGAGMASRIEDCTSDSLDEFYFQTSQHIEDGIPFVKVLDSMDAFDSKEDEEKFEEDKKAHEEEKDSKGSYGVSKAKLNSVRLRHVKNGLRKTDSILLIISQTRDNIQFPSAGKVYAGGRALKFYAASQMWLKRKKTLSKTVQGKPRQVGILTEIKLRKNHVSGREQSVEVPIYHSYGIDDIGSCIDYLVDEKHWKKPKQSIEAKEFGFKGTRDRLIAHIEQTEGGVLLLRRTTGKVWKRIVDATTVKRRPRYE